MKKILALMLILISSSAFSDNFNKFEVTCWHDDSIIFHRHAKDVYMGPGFITAVCKNHTYTVSADCLISYDTKKSKH